MTTAVAGGKPSRLRRTDAAVALAALVAAVVYVAVSAVSRWYVLLASIVSLGVTVIAAWYVLSRRAASRAIAGVVAGLALVFIAVVVASESIIVLVVGLALAAVSASLRGGGTRERLDSGVLGIAFARVGTAVEAEKLAALEAAGRVQRLWQTFLGHPIGTR